MDRNLATASTSMRPSPESSSSDDSDSQKFEDLRDSGHRAAAFDLAKPHIDRSVNWWAKDMTIEHREEVRQRAYLKVYLSMNKFDSDKAALGTWIKWEVRGVVSDYRKKLFRKETREESLDQHLEQGWEPTDDADHESDPGSQLDAAELHQKVREAYLEYEEELRKKNPKEAEILHRRLWKGDTFAAIDRSLGLKTGRAREVVRKHIPKLYEHFRARGIDPFDI